MEHFEDTLVLEEQEDETLQLAENTDIEQNQKEKVANEFVEKRTLLEKTKIVRQTWSISEIYQKSKMGNLYLIPIINGVQSGIMTKRLHLSNPSIWR